MSQSLQGKAAVFHERETVGFLNSGLTMAVLISMVFLGAFLLFSMEPLVGRLLVPYFGGAVHVWLICLMFFQAMLLVGYLYAHLFAQKVGPWHLLLLLLPLINLPLGVVTEPSPQAPLTTLLGVLVAQFALPFAVLSTTAVVAQLWLAHSTLGQDHNPYPLYAASNAGSLIALLGYPFFVEPLSGVKFQSLLWTIGYIFYGVLAVFAWFTIQPGKRPLTRTREGQRKVLSQASPTIRLYAQWLLLSALPSAFLLTVTNFIALEVGSFPMIWVIPLALYLCSFIITFRTPGGIPGSLGRFWPHLLLTCLMIYLLPINSAGWGMIIFTTALFFVICLIAHGTLYELRPSVDHLTVYYLLIAVGGFIGGISISLIAPVILSGLYEYPILLGALAIVFAWLSPAPLYFWRKTSSPIMHWGNMAIIVCLLGTLLIYNIRYFTQLSSESKFRHRNFYGTYRVIDIPPSEKTEAFRKLIHGMTLHGAQLLDKEKEGIPITYYHKGGPIADVYEVVPSPRHLAVVGLGAGVLSSYTRPYDSLTYYEIDPDNEKIARDWFTFLAKSKAPVSIVIGDGRLSLQNKKKDSRPYDVITIDAFSGDGIPTHLLTLEAVKVYLSHLSADGMLLFHISNRYYDLLPLMKAMGEQLKLYGVRNIPLKKASIGKYDSPALCVVFSRKAANLQPLIQRGWVPFSDHDGIAKTVPWTDDYINILSPLLGSFKVQ
jgi:spermidine synthase